MFALLQAVALLKYLQTFLSKSEFKYFFFVSATAAAGVVFAAVVGLTMLGVVAPWSGRWVAFSLLNYSCVCSITNANRVE